MPSLDTLESIAAVVLSVTVSMWVAVTFCTFFGMYGSLSWPRFRDLVVSLAEPSPVPNRFYKFTYYMLFGPYLFGWLLTFPFQLWYAANATELRKKEAARVELASIPDKIVEYVKKQLAFDAHQTNLKSTLIAISADMATDVFLPDDSEPSPSQPVAASYTDAPSYLAYLKARYITNNVAQFVGDVI